MFTNEMNYSDRCRHRINLFSVWSRRY